MVGALGITVYGCEPDEADLFNELAPRFGVAPTITRAAVSEGSIISAPDNRCVSVGHKLPVSATVLLALKEAGVEYISTRSIGLDHIDLDAAEKLGINVGNAAYSPDGVADFTLMLMLMALRNARTIVRAAECRDFRSPSVRGRELCDMTVGVVGVGRIGGAVIRRLKGFGCRVLAYSKTQRSTVADYVSLDELLTSSDIVTLHLPYQADTHHFIGRDRIGSMKRGALLINTGRGALVDTNALIAALDAEHLSGAALDVIEGEEGLFYFDCARRPIDNANLLRLLDMPNVIVTPHTAYHTDRVLHETVERTILDCLAFERSRGNG